MVTDTLCEYVRNSVKDKHTWALIKPHSQTLISHFVFPQMCFTAADEHLWSNEPAEYIHSKIGKHNSVALRFDVQP